jgi:deoxyribonuclease I
MLNFRIISMICTLSLGAFGFWVFKNKKIPLEQEIYQSGNQHIANFRAAKKIAAKIYSKNSITFYCGCAFQNKIVDSSSCGYKPFNPNSMRAKRIEWEHIVPASYFGRSFKEWRKGHPKCISISGKKYKGRRCARKVSEKFRKMEADLYNLAPAIGEVNSLRGSSAIGILGSKVTPIFGSCTTKIKGKIIEPRIAVRGFIARTYKYMDAAYPKLGIISRKNKKLFRSWDRIYPPDKEEIARAQKIKRLQKNSNRFVLEWRSLQKKLATR